jgi:L-lactate dehydrogenase complex protein LldG
MMDSSAAKAEILSRIRGPHAATTAPQAAQHYSKIERVYKRTGTLSATQRVELFEERLIEYDAHVHCVTSAGLSSAIGAALHERGAKRVVIPAGTPAQWFDGSIETVEGDLLSNLDLDEFDGVVSGCTVAIALTGTIVLQNAPAQGPRKLSLIPDYQLCVVFAEQIVETVSEAFDRLAATAKLPSTFISGPSATADIEMTRIKGVHGPRFLDVLIVT